MSMSKYNYKNINIHMDEADHKKVLAVAKKLGMKPTTMARHILMDIVEKVIAGKATVQNTFKVEES